MVWFRDDGLDAGSETAGSAGAISHGVVADLKRVQAPASERRRENPQVFLSHLLLFSNLMMVLIAIIIFTLNQQTFWGVWMDCGFWTLECQSLPHKHSTCSLFLMLCNMKGARFVKKKRTSHKSFSSFGSNSINCVWAWRSLQTHFFHYNPNIWNYNISSSTIRILY